MTAVPSLLRRTLLAGAFGWTALPVRAAPERLRLGVVPHLPAAALIERNLPLARYLQRMLAMPVDLVGAPDYRSHALRVRAGQYDLVLTAPQFVHLADEDGGYAPVAAIGRSLCTHVAVTADSPLKGLPDLRARRIAASDMLSLPSINGTAMLERAGLAAGSYDLRHYPNNSAALHALLMGDADALFIGMTSLTAATTEQRARVRMLATSEPLGPAYLLAKAGLPAELQRKLHAAMGAFADSAEGREFFGMRGIAAAELVLMRPADTQKLRWLNTITRRLLAST